MSYAVVLLALVLAFALYTEWSKRSRKSTDGATDEKKGVANVEAARPWGVWDAVKFAYPTVTPWLSFDVDKTRPIPFRPFRWGPSYPINMGIRPMPWDNWIELDNDYRKTLAIRKERTESRKELATTTLPGFHAHALETLLEISSFVAARYPHLFRVTRAKYDVEKPETYGDSLVEDAGGAVTSVTNLVTGDHFDFAEIERTEGPNWNPMRVAGLLQQDDLAVMVEGTDGQYFFQAGSICTAGFWRLEDKIGLPLEDIHARGKVPQWHTKLKFSMERFFQKMKVDKPVQRNNYFFQIDNQLAWSSNTNGPEKIFDQGAKGPVPNLLASSNDPTWKEPAPTADINDVYFRTERQTLRRLPKTGCIVFTIRTYFHKVVDIANEKDIPGRMASAIRSWPEDVATYKGSSLYKPIVLPYLDELHRQQVADGLVAVDEDGKNVLEQKYPF